jgi:hypothetical protein
VADLEKAFEEFQSAGGREALERQLAALDQAAQTSVRDGVDPDPRLMALREGLQRLLAALNDLGGTADGA